jgi:hypothetical protein
MLWKTWAIFVMTTIMSPFKSEKQRKYLWAKHPELAKKWTKKYGSKIKKSKKK